MSQLLELNLIEVVDTALETELQQDLSNIIIKCQHSLAQQRQSLSPERGIYWHLVTTLSDVLSSAHSSRQVRQELRGRGAGTPMESCAILRVVFRAIAPDAARQQYPILDTTTSRMVNLTVQIC